ncbi:hypothetical protein B9Z55_005978 [Caenorhabditis nigoni]|uniref:Uncharacterized protein n=1 Tax=Caenorhabditis nigoni TaxID=1611254 RepID=A0A2G5V350_9PELO|nr:hypothetical protein B9Z55_005978 [Caenorhabditis nigoni]
MVCLPCIFLPIMMAIYMKFIMPYVYRFLPERWVHFLDPILYPTCPMKIPEQEKKEEGEEKEKSCCAGGAENTTEITTETKKDQ